MKDSRTGESRSVSNRIKEATSLAAERVKDVSAKVEDKTSSALAESSSAVSRKVADAASSVASSAYAASGKAADLTRAAMGDVQSRFKKALGATVPIADKLSVTTQGLLASSLSDNLNGWLQEIAKGSATIYDQAMDATYNATHVGGSFHRLFDGGHTIPGAFEAARGASADDSIVHEALGTLQGLFRDGTTPRGLPLANWDKETFDHVATTLESNFRISREWFYDLNTYDAAELLGGTVGVLALALGWNRADTETFARFVGSMGLSSAISANPLLLVVTVAALAKAFHSAHQTGEYAEFIDGQLKGGMGAGATVAAVSLVGVAGGPAGAALLAGVAASVLANLATKNVSVTQVFQLPTSWGLSRVLPQFV
ncbi:MAG: hypothetical protein OXU75_06525, partial [Deltaproteobacteria bacterium]|nr:hypothetical protein [Deltaproteobacteria bacterium]